MKSIPPPVDPSAAASLPPPAASPAGRWKLVALAACYWLVLVTVTHWPGGSTRMRLPWAQADKMLHAAIFAGLGLVVSLVASAFRRPGWMAAVAVFGLLAIYAAIDEYTQQWVPLREPDVRDWMADVAGAALGVLAFSVLQRLVR